jgi:short chain dehydrogenase
MNTLHDKTLFITGASRGIGKAIAAKAAEPDPRLPGTIHSAAAEIEGAGGQALAVVVDVRDEAQVSAAVAEAVERFGGIDIATAALDLAAPGQAGRARKPEIMAEAAYWILTQDSRQVTGRSLLAEDVLREAGIGDFSRYAMDPAITPNLDYFVEA